MAQIRVDTENEFHRLRCFSRLILKPEFADAFDMANEQQRKDLEKILKTGDKKELNNWINAILKDPELLSHRQLRDKAKRIGIKNYSLLDKVSLINEIDKAERYEESRNNRRNSEN